MRQLRSWDRGIVVLRGIKKKPLKEILVVQPGAAKGALRDIVEDMMNEIC